MTQDIIFLHFSSSPFRLFLTYLIPRSALPPRALLPWAFCFLLGDRPRAVENEQNDFPSLSFFCNFLPSLSISGVGLVHSFVHCFNLFQNQQKAHFFSISFAFPLTAGGRGQWDGRHVRPSRPPPRSSGLGMPCAG